MRTVARRSGTVAPEYAGQGEPSLVNTDTTLLAARVRGSC
jgi:hypothetical protein